MIDFEKEGHIAKVGLNIRETLNALSPDALLRLHQVWEECGKDDSIRVVVFHSALPDIFCSGMDIKTSVPLMTGQRKPETEGEQWLFDDWKGAGRAMLKVRDLDRPVIAAINGLCLTGGWEMSMGCELRVASDDARFQMREVTLGIMPVGGSSVFLPAQVGQARAMEVLLTGDYFDAATLFEWGWLNRVVPREKLMDQAMALAERIAGNGPRAVRALVRTSRAIRGLSQDDALETELKIGGPVLLHEDVREGFKAQKEKRKPDFK